MSTNLSNRVSYADALRIFAVFMVIVLHISAGQLSRVDAGSAGLFWEFDIYNGLARCCVPLFVMVSGMFLLDEHKSLEPGSVLRKYLPRMICAFVFWSAVYTILFHLPTKEMMQDMSLWETVCDVTGSFLKGHYHLWFLYMMAGLYLIVPFLRAIIQRGGEQLTTYFLILWMIFNCILPMISSLHLIPVLDLLQEKMWFRMTLGYSGYFVAGYYLSRTRLTGKTRGWIYILGFIGTIVTIAGTGFLFFKEKEAIGIFYSYFAPNVVMQTAAVFLFFKESMSKKKQKKGKANLLKLISSCTFGIFLIHDMIMRAIIGLGWNPVESIPGVGILLLAIAVLLASLLIVMILKRIPVFGKYCL